MTSHLIDPISSNPPELADVRERFDRGQRAYLSGDLRLAIEQYSQALDTLHACGSPDPDLEFKVRQARSDALALDGDNQAYDQEVEALLSLARAMGDDDRLATTALTRLF